MREQERRYVDAINRYKALLPDDWCERSRTGKLTWNEVRSYTELFKRDRREITDEDIVTRSGLDTFIFVNKGGFEIGMILEAGVTAGIRIEAVIQDKETKDTYIKSMYSIAGNDESLVKLEYGNPELEKVLEGIIFEQDNQQ